MQGLKMLWLRRPGALERRRAGRWPFEWAMEGWLRLDGDPGELIPVILVDFSTDGVGVVLFAHHDLHPGQRGELITQAHGAGCNYQPVSCSWQQTDPRRWQLQRAGLRFDRKAWA